MRIESVRGGRLPQCSPESTLREAAGLMVQNDCDCLLVNDGGADSPLVGFVTLHDLSAALLLQGDGSADPPRVRDAMSLEVEMIDASAATARRRGVESLPLLMLMDEDGAIVAFFAPVARYPQLSLEPETAAPGSADRHQGDLPS